MGGERREERKKNITPIIKNQSKVALCSLFTFLRIFEPLLFPIMWGKLAFAFSLYALVTLSAQMRSKGWDTTLVSVFLFLLLVVWAQTRFHRVADGTAVVFEKMDLFKPWKRKCVLVRGGTHFTFPYVFDVIRNSDGDSIVVPTSEPRSVTIVNGRFPTKNESLDIVCYVIFSFRYEGDGENWDRYARDPEEYLRIDIAIVVGDELRRANLGNLRPEVLGEKLVGVVSKHVSEAKSRGSDAVEPGTPCYARGMTVSDVRIVNLRYSVSGDCVKKRGGILDDVWGVTAARSSGRHLEEEEGKGEEEE